MASLWLVMSKRRIGPLAATLVALCLSVASGISIAASPVPNSSDGTQARSTVRKFLAGPSFEANVGQYSPTVKFVAHQKKLTVALLNDFSVAVYPPSEPSSMVNIRIVGGDPDANISGEWQAAAGTNRYSGGDRRNWEENVPTYGRVRYKSVYPGIDLLYYGNSDGVLEHDFLVAPLADAGAIRMRISGAGKVAITKAGELLFAKGEVKLNRPIAYQQVDGVRREVDCRYRIKRNGEVTFDLGSYDRSQALVIDPTLVGNAIFGGTSVDMGSAVALDAQGNAYVVGTTYSTDIQLPSTAQFIAGGGTKCGPFGTFSVCSDAFVAKLDVGGGIVYFTYLGGNLNDTGASIAIDNAGNAYVTGSTQSANFPVVNAAQSTLGGGTDCGAVGEVRNCEDAFVAKLSPTGTLLWSTYLGGSESDKGQGIAAASSGAVWVTGSSVSTNLKVTAGALNKTCTADASQHCNDGFVAHLTSSGTLDYLSYLHGTGAGAFVDAAGLGYVSGSTSDATYVATANAYKSAPASGGDGFIAVFDSTKSGAGSLKYSSFLGISGGKAVGSWLDSNNKLYISAVSSNPQVLKLDPTVTGAGALLFATQLPADAHLTATAPVLDSAGNILVAGTGQIKPLPLAPPLPAVYISQISPTGVLNATEYYSSAVPDTFTGIAIDPTDSVDVAGTFYNSSPGHIMVRRFSANLPPLQASPSPLIFNKQTTSVSAQGNILVVNNSSSPNTITNLVTPSVFGLTTLCGFQPLLPVTGQCLITLTYTNKASGITAGTVTFNSSSSPTAHSIYVYIDAGLPAVSFNPATVDFGNVPVGSSVTRTAVLTNAGDGIYPIATITSSNITETHDCGTSVPAYGQCTFKLTFTPKNSLDVASNVLVNPYPGTSTWSFNPTVTLNVSGAATVPQGISLSPTSLQFTTGQGTTSAPQTVTLTNSTAGALSNVTLAMSGDFAVQSNTCGVVGNTAGSVAANSSCNINVTFTPTTTGVRTGVLTETDVKSGNSASRTVALLGNGPATPTVGVNPTSLSFGNQLLSSVSVPKTLTLTNSGTAVLQITGITADGPYSQSNNCGVALPPNQTCTITALFTPVATGSATGHVVINSNTTAKSVTLSGTGTSPVPEVVLANPNSRFSGSPDFAIAVNGSGFMATSVVQWIASSTTTNLTTTFVSSSTLQATVPAALVTSAGTAQIKVFTPTPGGGTSAALNFSVTANNPPVGTIESAIYQGNFTTTVPQNALLHVSGWAIDQDQGSPVTSVQVHVDPGTGTGNVSQNAVLGGLRADVAAAGGRKDYYQSGWYADIPTNALSQGTYTVTAVASDAAGATAAVGPSQNITVVAPVGGAVPGVSAQSIDFGTVIAGSTLQQTLMLTNVGSGSLSVGSVSVTGPFTVANTCTSSLAAGASCSLLVSFQPKSPAPATGTLTIKDNGTPASVQVTLSGNGKSASPTLGRPPRPSRNPPI